jgi:hypothetical protein
VAGSNQGGRGSGSDGRRPTKAERRDEARLKREEIQRRMSRRRRSRSIGLVLLAVAVVVVVVAVFLTSGGSGGGNSNIASAADLLKQAPAAKQSSGCDPVQTTPNYANAPGADPSIDHAHIGSAEAATAPALSTYATIPPASGPHNSGPLPPGIYDSPPDVFQTIHSLEHGATIIWYAPGTTGKALDDLLAFYGQPQSDANIGQAKIIIAPYDYPDQGTAGQLPSGVQMAVVAWHRLETCSTLNLAVAFDFSSRFEAPGYGGRTYSGVAREAGAVM